jgi:hypothetical protein
MPEIPLEKLRTLRADMLASVRNESKTDYIHALVIARAFLPADVFNHSVRVAEMGDVNDRAVGVLHDLLEDSGAGFDTMLAMGISFHVARDVLTVTRRGDETYFDYIRRVRDYGSSRAQRVKVSDLNDHFQQAGTLTASLFKRYTKAMEILGP